MNPKYLSIISTDNFQSSRYVGIFDILSTDI